jgi:DNA-binding NarL/FixJ family response regulator
VEIVGRLRPAVALIDMRMPVMDGITACSEIRRLAPETQVIILSAYGDRALQRGAQEAGVYCYMIKGCRPELITQMLIQAWLHGRTAPAPAVAAPADPASATTSGSEELR